MSYQKHTSHCAEISFGKVPRAPKLRYFRRSKLIGHVLEIEIVSSLPGLIPKNPMRHMNVLIRKLT